MPARRSSASSRCPARSTRTARASARSTRLAARLDAALIETRDVNALETLNAVRKLEPELIFVVGWSQLVHDPFIALAREGVFGMHPTLLPRHRGRAPIPWAILTGLARTGVTLFEIVDATADSGAIVGQVAMDIAPDETATTLFARLAEAHVDAHRASSCRSSSRGPRRGSRRIRRRASAWPKRAPADGIIDWETRAPYLYDWVRAQTRPYPGAFTYLGEDKVIVWGARPVELGGRRACGDDRRRGRRTARSSRAARAASCSRRSRPRRSSSAVGDAARMTRVLVLRRAPRRRGARNGRHDRRPRRTGRRRAHRRRDRRLVDAVPGRRGDPRAEGGRGRRAPRRSSA